MYFWQWMLANKEVIAMFANIATVIAMTVAIIAIIMTKNTIDLQRKSIQAQLFSDISSRINELEDQWFLCDTQEKKRGWHEKLFNAFEFFAFSVNQKILSKEMKTYYKSGIKTYIERLKWPQYAELLDAYKKRPTEQYCELRKYYQNEIGTDFPF